MKRHSFFAAGTLGILFLTACGAIHPVPTTTDAPNLASDSRPPEPRPRELEDQGGLEAESSVKHEKKEAPSLGAEVEPVRDVVPAETSLQEDEMVMFNLEDITVAEFAELVFGELLKKNYVLAQDVRDFPNKISVSMTKPIPKNQVIFLVAGILQRHQIFLEEREGAYHLMMGAGEVTPLFRYGKEMPPSPDYPGLICQVIPLNHIHPVQIDALVRRYLGKSGSITIELQSNSLIVIDEPRRIGLILDIVNLFDKELFEKTVFKIAKPVYWEPSSMAKQIESLLRVESIPGLKPGQSVRGTFLLPIDRLGEIYIFSSEQEWMEKILGYVDMLDQPQALGGEERAFVYFPKSTSADSLGQIVDQVFFGSAAGRETLSMQSEPSAAAEQGRERTPTAASANIIIDNIRNCLIVRAKPSVWAGIKELIEKLDVPPKQVLIEALIGELTLDKQFQLGLEWFLKNNDVKIKRKDFVGSGGTEEGLGLGGLGFFYTLVAKDDLFRMAVNAFVTQNLIKIISAPRIVGTDNQEARIEIGTEVPVVTSEAVTGQFQLEGSTGMLRSIQYRSTGVILTVTPTIHSEGLITLDIQQEVSEAQANIISPQIQSPIILKRSVRTNLVARDGETVFIGGLISKSVSSTKAGIPILSKIPLIGSLFKTRSDSERRTELIILLTPRIVSEVGEIDFITEEFRKKMWPDIREASMFKDKDK